MRGGQDCISVGHDPRTGDHSTAGTYHVAGDRCRSNLVGRPDSPAWRHAPNPFVLPRHFMKISSLFLPLQIRRLRESRKAERAGGGCAINPLLATCLRGHAAASTAGGGPAGRRRHHRRTASPVTLARRQALN